MHITTTTSETPSAERELTSALEELSLYRQMVDAVSDYAIFRLDPNGHVATWNEGAHRLKGYTAKEIIGRHFSIFYTQDLREQRFPEHELETATEVGRFEHEGWRVRKDGTRFWANVVITRIADANGKVLGFTKVTRDLTDRKLAEEARLNEEVLNARLASSQQNEEQLRALANTIPQLAWMAHPDGYIFWYNQRWYDYTGVPPGTVDGWGWESLHDASLLPKVNEAWARSLQSGEPFEMEFPLRGADGQFRWFLTRVLPLRNSEGKVLRWFGTNTDVEDQRRIRAELVRALSIRDEFLSIASHELKTPLTALKLRLQITDRQVKPELDSVPPAKKLKDSLGISLRQVESLTTLVDDLLDTSKIQSGKFTVSPGQVELADLIQDVVKRYREQLASAHCEVQLQLTPVTGNWDENRLSQVLANFISNAIKYAPGSPIRIALGVSGNSVSLEFADSGPGIPKARHAQVFERFERAGASSNIGGLGLGLFIVKTIVEAHKGTIRVEGDTGIGTTFIVELPLDPFAQA